MAKHRKTRRDKKIADHRHTLYHIDTNTAEDKSPVEKKSKTVEYKIKTSPQKSTTVSYAYVLNDIRKITFISTVLIITQFVLYIVINRI